MSENIHGFLSTVWKSVSPEQWRAILDQHLPQNLWRVSGERIDGLCPIHGGTHVGSFSILPKRGMCKCLAAGCGYFESNPIRFLERVLHLSWNEVVNDVLRGMCGVKVGPKLLAELEAAERVTKVKQSVGMAMHRVLVRVAHDPDNPAYSYLRPGYEYLLHRGVSPNRMLDLPLGLVPTTPDLCAEMPADMASPALQWLGGMVPDTVRESSVLGAPVFLYESAAQVISGLKVRPLPKGPDASGPKGLWLGNDQGFRGFYGVRTCSTLLGGVPGAGGPLDSTYVVVEGEFDALSCQRAEEDRNAGIPQIVFLGAGGGASENLGTLARIGARAAVIVGDNDKAGSGISAQEAAGHSRFSISRLLRAVSWPLRLLEASPELDCSVFHWDQLLATVPTLDVKDPDELVMGGHFEAFRKTLLEDIDGILAREDWAAMRAVLEIEALTSAGKRDAASLSDVIERYQRALKRREQVDVYLDELRSRGCVPDALVRMRQGRVSTETEFVAAIATRLSDQLSFLAHDKVGRCVVVRSEQATLRLSLVKPSDAISALGLMVFRGGIRAWAEENVGLPPFVTEPVLHGKPTAASLPKQEQILAEYVMMAVTRLASVTPPIEGLREVGQGLHLDRSDRPNADDSQCIPPYIPNAAGRLVLVNGPDVYTAWLSPDSAPDWYAVKSGLVGAFLPRTSAARWSPWLRIDHLRANNQGSLEEVYHRLTACLHAGWTFSNDPAVQTLEAKYLAGFLIYAVAAALFRTTCLVWLVAPAGSGKSTFLQGLVSGQERRVIHLLEPATGAGVFTSAGIAQSMVGDSRLLCADELETHGTDPKKRDVTANLLETFRGLITEGGSQKVQGTASGVAVRTELRFPVVAAAISPPTDEANVTRFNFIQLARCVGVREPPEQIVLRMLGGDDGVAAMRRSLTLVPLQNLHLLHRAYLEQSAKPWYERQPPGIDSRFIDITLPTLSTLSACGENLDTFAPEYLSVKGQQRSLFLTPQWERVLWHMMLRPAVRVAGSPQPVSVDACMRQPAFIRDMHDACVGTYIVDTEAVEGHASQKVLVIVGRQVLTNILAHSDYGNGSAEALLGILRQSPAALSVRDLDRLGVLSRAQRHMTMQLRPNDIVALRIDDITAAPVRGHRLYKPDVVTEATNDDLDMSNAL